jgi:superkiller protein 3
VDEAIKVGEEVLAENPGDTVVWDLALACNRANRPADAIKYCRLGLSHHPEEDSLYDQLGVAYRIMGDLDKAIESGRRAVELVDNVAGYQNNLGSAYSMAGRYREARKYLEKALDIQPRFSEAWFNLGVLCMRTEDYAEAEKHLRRAIEEEKGNVDAWVQLNKVLLYQERSDEALAMSEELTKIRPGAPGNDYFKSVAYRQKKDYVAAEKALRAFLERNPGFAPAHEELCEVLLAKQPPDLEGARRAARRAQSQGIELSNDMLGKLGM